MKKIKKIALTLMALIIALSAFAGCKKGNEDKYTKDGKLIISMANTSDASTEDILYDYISDKFSVSVSYLTLSWSDWEQKVNTMMLGDTASDIVSWDFRPQKFPTYKEWAEGGMIKPLPDDLSAYPNVKAALDSNPDIERFKIDGKLYCFPVVNTVNPDAISDIRYMYRRDWAKELGKYKENDIYTLAEFEDLLRSLKSKCNAPLADVGWSTPSIENYYFNDLGSFIKKDPSDPNSEYAWKYENDSGFKSGVLEKAAGYYTDGMYWKDFYQFTSGSENKTKYRTGQAGVTYDNFTLRSLVSYREEFRTSNPFSKAEIKAKYPTQELYEEWVRESTAPLYIKREDGSFYTEELGYWWSVNLFAAGVSDNKMSKFLEMMDWFLSEEGTNYAAYGIEGIHWEKKDGAIVAREGINYANLKLNSKYLRGMVSTNGDVLMLDPTIRQKDREDYEEVYKFYKTQLTNNNLTLNRLPKVNWLTGPVKDQGSYAKEMQDYVVRYIQKGSAADTEWNNTVASFRNDINAILGEINSQRHLV